MTDRQTQPGRPTVLVAHPSPDLYGSDRQLLETVRGAVEAGWRVVVALPQDGPLVPALSEAGAEVVFVPGPVLRRSSLTPRGLASLVVALPSFVVRAGRQIRDTQPDEVLVNTVTIPWWLAAARLWRRPAICHVHEAESDAPGWIRAALALPLMLATSVVMNSRSSYAAVVQSWPGLGRRSRVVYNGVQGPRRVASPRSRAAGDPLEVVLVGRLSPRKGTDVALEAVAQLRADGTDVRLRLGGSVFDGYEWFEDELRARAAQPDLRGAVEFCGYVADPAAMVAAADAVLVPSRTEPFGNTAVEALLAERPLVASRVQGLAEIVRDRVTGLLAEPGDPVTLAAGLRRVAQDPEGAAAMARRGRRDAEQRFSLARYRQEMVAVMAAALRSTTVTSSASALAQSH